MTCNWESTLNDRGWLCDLAQDLPPQGKPGLGRVPSAVSLQWQELSGIRRGSDTYLDNEDV